MRKHNLKSKCSSSIANHKVILPNPRGSGFLPDTTTPPSTDLNKWRGYQTDILTYSLSIDSHITILSKVELSRKRISLLLEQEIVRIATEGFNLIDYFAVEWMMNYLIGSSGIHDIRGNKMSTVVYCAYLVLLQYREHWNLLYKRVPLFTELQEFIFENFGSLTDRKYQSRRLIYSLDKFLMFRIEEVQSSFERDKFKKSVRYSSYCKGYGEGGRSVRKQKTRFSYELDRDDHENEQLEEIKSFSCSIHNQEDLFVLEQKLRKLRKA